MAASFLPTFFLFFFLSSGTLLLCTTEAQSIPKPRGFVFPINKDDNTSQYYTTIRVGSTNITKLNVAIDIGAKFLWFYSLRYLRAASSFRPILCDTPQCQLVDDPGCTVCYATPPVPGCYNNSCSDYGPNPFSGDTVYSGLGQDVLRACSTSGHLHKVNSFSFQFSFPDPKGLASSTVGVIGLGRSRISLQAILASAFNISQKFAMCISPSGNQGNLIIGDAAYKKPFSIISKTLFTTPLVRNPVGTWANSVIGNFSIEYFIDVKSIKVGATPLALNKTLLSIDKTTGGGGTCIRTVKGYTSLDKSIYTALINEFVKAAAKRSIKRVASVAPFGACFDSKTIKGSKTGPDVPIIDLVLQSNSVYWRFYGSNSMVRVGKDVMCLAFVEGETNIVGPTNAIVVGGYQMENYLLEFDVASSRLGFSSSLMMHDTSCSQLRAA